MTIAISAEFSDARYGSGEQQWGFKSRTQAPDGTWWRHDGRFLAAAELVGKAVNIRLKDGTIYLAVQVTGFSVMPADRPVFAVSGGLRGTSWNDLDPRMVTSQEITLWEIAKGEVRDPGECTSVYAECPPLDQQCIGLKSHRHGPDRLHSNRSGFAWSDQEAAESAARAQTKERE